MEKNSINYSLVPLVFLSEMQAWIEKGEHPSECLSSILENDFIGAITQASPLMLDSMLGIVEFLKTEAPKECWGSKESVLSWKGDPYACRV